jgi:hypothetical protein
MRQKAKAIDAFGSCQYRAPDGKKCAVGCLIPKRLYTSSIEGLPADSSTLIPIYKKLGINSSNLAFLHSLQWVHDNNAESDWKDKLRVIAKEHHLKIPACLK